MLASQICDKINSPNKVKQMNYFQKIYQRCMCCTDRRVKLHLAKERNKRAEHQISKEFDINYIVKLLRFHRMQLKTLTNKRLRRMSMNMSARYISQSEHDSDLESSENENNRLHQEESLSDESREQQKGFAKFFDSFNCIRRQTKKGYLGLPPDDQDKIA